MELDDSQGMQNSMRNGSKTESVEDAMKHKKQSFEVNQETGGNYSKSRKKGNQKKRNTFNMDSPVSNQEIQADDNENIDRLNVTVTPVQNSLAMRLKQMMKEGQIPELHVDNNVEIDLNEEGSDQEHLKKSPERVPHNTLDEWFRKRTPKASPANKKRKLSIFKDELLNRIKEQRREDQKSRQKVFEMDNEIFEEEEEEEEEICPDEDASEQGEDAFEQDEDHSDQESTAEEDHSDQESTAEEDHSDQESTAEEDVIDEVDSVNNSKGSTTGVNEENSGDFVVDESSNSLSPFIEMKKQSCGGSSDSNNEIPKQMAAFDSMVTEPKESVSTVSIHKTSSNLRIGSTYLAEEFDSQQLDSQTLAAELQNLMDEQNTDPITERENYELILNLTKFDKKQADKPSKMDEDEHIKRKRKPQIESDDEEEAVTGSLAIPSNEVTKLAKMNDDDLFKIDDGEDQFETRTGPFLDTVRVVLDEDQEDDDYLMEPNPEPKLENEVTFEENKENEGIDGGVALETAKNKWIDDEAVLSGSDVESDEEEDSEDQDDDFVESMDVDEDEVDQTELRDGIIKTHMKLVNIDEERHLNKLKEIYDDALNPNTKWDRSFRSRLQEGDVDFQALVTDPLLNGSQSDGEDDEVITFKDYLAKKEAEAKEDEQWKLFTLASIADDLSQDIIDNEASSSSNSHTHNPNGIAKFIAENYYFQDASRNTK